MLISLSYPIFMHRAYVSWPLSVLFLLPFFLELVSLVALACDAAPIKIKTAAFLTAALSSAATMGTLRLMGETSPIERIEAPLKSGPSSSPIKETSPIQPSITLIDSKKVEGGPTKTIEGTIPINEAVWWENVWVHSGFTWQDWHDMLVNDENYDKMIEVLLFAFGLRLEEEKRSDYNLGRHLELIEKGLEDGKIFGDWNKRFMARFGVGLFDAVKRKKVKL
jgi:hypothetical protein